MVYQWKSISGIKADPNKAAEQFEQLEHTVGLTPKNLLDANRAVGTVLHNEFEWNDTTAAENYRIHQAGQIIRMLCVKPETEVKDPTPIRAYFTTSESKSYEHINIILKSPDKYAELKAKAFSELQAFQRKYSMLSELDELMAVISKVLE